MLDSPAKRCFIPRENETSSSVRRVLECSSRSQVKLQNLWTGVKSHRICLFVSVTYEKIQTLFLNTPESFNRCRVNR